MINCQISKFSILFIKLQKRFWIFEERTINLKCLNFYFRSICIPANYSMFIDILNATDQSTKDNLLILCKLSWKKDWIFKITRTIHNLFFKNTVHVIYSYQPEHVIDLLCPVKAYRLIDSCLQNRKYAFLWLWK